MEKASLERKEIIRLRNKLLPLRKCPVCGTKTRSMVCWKCRKKLWRKFVNGGGLEKWL